MLTISKTLTLVGGEQRVRLNIVLRGATGDMVVVGRTVVSNGGKSVDDSSRDDDEKGANQHSSFECFHV